jgi:D-beta-D-heptose 7-phosphate kinase/D-beta-D-heptose 1-phosphate adenosyltransferase
MKGKNIKITIIGDKCLDVFIYGKSDRLSPEAPVPIFEEIRRVENWGMAANVVANINSLCKLDTLNNIELISHLSPNYETKIRYVDDKSNHIFLRVDQKKEREYQFQMTFEIQEDIKTSNVVIISDYDKNYLSISDILEITSLKSNDCKILLDTKKKIHDKHLLNRIDYVKMNAKEYNNNKTLHDDSVDDKIIVTLGDDGAMYKNVHYQVNKKQTIDVSGAGDTFLASLGYYLALEYSIIDAIKFANEMASIVVTKRGVSVI